MSVPAFHFPELGTATGAAPCRQLRSKEESLSATLAVEPRTYRDLMRRKRLQDELGDVRTEIEELKQQLEAQVASSWFCSDRLSVWSALVVRRISA